MRRALCAGILTLVALVALTALSNAASAHPAAAGPSASTITVDTWPVPLRIEVNGTPAIAPFSFSCDPGTNRTINPPSSQANGSTRYTFVNWSDGGSQSHVIECAASGTYTAFFSTEYAQLIETGPRGLSVEVDGLAYTAPVIVWCRSGSVYRINAPSPQEFNATRFEFTTWGDGGEQSHAVSCDSARLLVASFRATTAISVFSNLQGGFVVHVDGFPRVLPHQIVCDVGTDHELFVPTPQSVSGVQWRFVGWSDFGPNPRTIRCDGPRNYTATFERVEVAGTPPDPGLLLVLVIVAIVGLAVALPVTLLWWTNRKRAPQVALPPVALGVGPPPSPANRCLRCGSPNAPDWSYCMMCGAPMR